MIEEADGVEIIWVMSALFTPVLAVIVWGDAIRTDRAVWAAVGRSRAAWLLIALVPIVGALVYLFLVNPELELAAETMPS